MRHCGIHPYFEDLWFGAVTTDDYDGFVGWLDKMMPTHKVVATYDRNPSTQAADGGYKTRINIHCDNKVEQMLFKLTWA